MAITTIESKVKNLAAEQLNLPATKILTTTGWRELGGDSSIYGSFILSLEKEFNVRIPDKTAASFKTLDDVVAYLKSLGVSIR